MAWHYNCVTDSNGWEYCWDTVRKTNNDLWEAWEMKPNGMESRSRRFKKRASAKRCALRWRDGRARVNERSKLKQRCNMCGEHSKLKGDYLCGKCRYGY